MTELIIFIFLFSFTVINKTSREVFLNKGFSNHILDLLNLTLQGTIIPLLAAIVASQLLGNYFEIMYRSIEFPWWSLLFINFFIVDYLYYWNHRLLHNKSFFFIHKVHHTMESMDTFGTSRNTLWSSFFIVYFWINTSIMFSAADPTYYLIGATISASLDLWKHSSFLTKNLKIISFISTYFLIMTPNEHAWHHATKLKNNYGANFNIYDKLHRTYYKNFNCPDKLGLNIEMSFWKKLLFPF